MTALPALASTLAAALRRAARRLRCPHPEALERPVWLKIRPAASGELEMGTVRRCGLCGRERVTRESEVRLPLFPLSWLWVMTAGAAAAFVWASTVGAVWVAELVGGFLEK